MHEAEYPTTRSTSDEGGSFTLFLNYRPPYNWAALRDFLRTRLIAGLEWIDDDSYGRSFHIEPDAQGWFTATHCPEQQGFRVEVSISRPSAMPGVERTITRLLDLDADSERINDHLAPLVRPLGGPIEGLRLPGTLSLFEAGVRAILGQQVSVVAAHKLVAQLVSAYGQRIAGPDREVYLFPTPSDLADTDLAALRMPGQRKQSVIDLACLFRDEPEAAVDPDNWLTIRGIGPWSVQYARLRGLSESDIWLGSDLGVKRALQREDVDFDPAEAAPWRSYLTLHCWSLA